MTVNPTQQVPPNILAKARELHKRHGTSVDLAAQLIQQAEQRQSNRAALLANPNAEVNVGPKLVTV